MLIRECIEVKRANLVSGYKEKARRSHISMDQTKPSITKDLRSYLRSDLLAKLADLEQLLPETALRDLET